MATAAGQNAQPDPNTVPGWTTQGSAAQASLGTGVPGAGYAQPGGVQSVFTGQASAGVPNPPLAFDVQGENSASFGESILTNPGYADVNPAFLSAGVAIPAPFVPVPASNVAFQSPTSLAATVVISGGTLTSVKTAAPGGSLAQVGTADGTYTVPAGGQIELTYTAAPTWTWTTATTSGAA